MLSVIARDLWSSTKGVASRGGFAKGLAAVSHVVAEASEGYGYLMKTKNPSEHVATTCVKT